MDKGSLRVWGMAPTRDNLGRALATFAKGGYGRVTSPQDDLLGALMRAAPEESDLETVPFAEIVATALSYSGERRLPAADEKSYLEAVRHAVERTPEGSPFYASRALPGVQRRLQKTLRLLRSHRWPAVAPDALDFSVDGMESTLRDLLAEVDAILENSAIEDPLLRVERCLNVQLPHEHALARLFVALGEDESPLTLDWLTWARAQGCNVVVCVFAREREGAFDSARRIARRLGVPLEPIGVSPVLCESLFSDEIGARPEIEVEIVSAPDPLAECEWALRRCRKALHAGSSPRDIAIFMRNLPDYAPLLIAASRTLDVPLKISGEGVVESTQLARWTLEWLESTCEASPQRLRRCANSSYVCAPEIQPDEALFPLEWATWETLEQTSSALPENAWLRAVLAWRRANLGPELTIRERLDRFETALECDAYERIRGSADPAEARDRACLEEALKSLARRAQMGERSGTTSLSRWIETTRAVWKLASFQYSLGDRGIVATSNPTELSGVAHVLSIGMLEGSFPRRRTDDPILSDAQREAMNATLDERYHLPTSHALSERERNLLVTVCAAPTRSLTLSYPASNDDRDSVPAFYLAEIERVVGDALHKTAHAFFSVPSTADWDAARADVAFAQALGEPLRPNFEETVDDARVRSNPDEKLTLRNLREANECPFKFGFHGKLDVYGSSERTLSLHQLPQWANLAAQSTPDGARSALEAELNLRLERASGRLTEGERKLIRMEGLRQIEAVVASEFLAREQWKRTDREIPQPSFGDPELRSKLELTETVTVELQGSIGSVSTVGAYRVGKVYGARSAFADAPSEWTETEKLEAGLLFAALATQDKEPAIEFCRPDGERVLVTRNRRDLSVVADQKRGLKVVSVDAKETGFMGSARDIAVQAVNSARDHRLETRPSAKLCERCDLGELCRRSAQFGEEAEFGAANEIE